MGLLNTVIKAKLPAGEYPINIISYKDVENDKGGYVEVTIALPDRTIRQNFFPSNIDYLGKTLKAQLKRDDEMPLNVILDEAIKSAELFAVISYNDYGMNLAFHHSTSAVAEDVDY